MKTLFILIFVVLFLASEGYALQKKSTKSNVITGEIYSDVPFDLNADKLPADFLGNDIQQVYKPLQQRKKRQAKDEFESTSEYEARFP